MTTPIGSTAPGELNHTQLKVLNPGLIQIPDIGKLTEGSHGIKSSQQTRFQPSEEIHCPSVYRVTGRF